MNKICTILLLATVFGCKQPNVSEVPQQVQPEPGSFGYDVEFLQRHLKNMLVLGDTATGAIAIAPEYQGRVMTSTLAGMGGRSLGWINHELIASGKLQAHINAYGGEERFWLGPEGGQYGFYFPSGSAFTFENWAVPPALDTEPFRLVSSDKQSASFEREVLLENHSGNIFNIRINRTISMLGSAQLDSLLHGSLPAGLSVVAFGTDNRITNTGKEAFKKETGLPSIWILSMLQATEGTWIGIPYRTSAKGRVVTDDYFGKVPADRLLVGDSIIRFRADAKFRSKIGVSPGRALPWVCSYAPGKDGADGLLTMAFFDLPSEHSGYVNSTWKKQDDPFSGDAVNAYNDGPNESGSSMGNFYELESSSPGAALQTGSTLRHRHLTVHLAGSHGALESVFRRATGMRLSVITGQ